MFNLPENFWKRLWPVLSDASVHNARAAFLESIWDLTNPDSRVFERLSDSQVADLFLLLTRLFPPEKYFERMMHPEMWELGIRFPIFGNVV